MTLGEAIARELPRLRAEAESMMLDTIRLDHQTGMSDPDPITLEQVPVYATDYQGPGRVQRPGTQPNEPFVGEIEFGTLAAIVQLPIRVVVAERGQRVTVVASELDPAMAGVTFTVGFVQTKTHATMRRLFCTEVAT